MVMLRWPLSQDNLKQIGLRREDILYQEQAVATECFTPPPSPSAFGDNCIFKCWKYDGCGLGECKYVVVCMLYLMSTCIVGLNSYNYYCVGDKLMLNLCLLHWRNGRCECSLCINKFPTATPAAYPQQNQFQHEAIGETEDRRVNHPSVPEFQQFDRFQYRSPYKNVQGRGPEDQHANPATTNTQGQNTAYYRS